jgi:uncharacterized protein YceK
MRTFLAVTLFASLAGLSGCGTLFNLGQDAQPYGGVVLETQIIASGVPQGLYPFIPDFDVPQLWPLAVVDMPFSLVGDTLTLPITLAIAMQKQYADPLQNR